MFLTAEQRKKLMSALAGGLFVTCGKEKPNIMTTHWGALGAFWHKQVFVLPVRAGKRSHEILAETGSFVPFSLRKAGVWCFCPEEHQVTASLKNCP